MTKTIPLSEVREGDFLVCNGKRTRVTRKHAWAVGPSIDVAGEWIVPESTLAQLGVTAERREPVKVVVHAERADYCGGVLYGSFVENASVLMDAIQPLEIGSRYRITLEEIE